MEKLLERDLYGPVKDYLESLGYEVKGEVKSCDLTALRDGELIVVELKKGFTLELIYQAMARQQLADGVYVAVPLPKRSYKAPHVRDMQTLCRRLELGLIFVGFSSTGVAQVDVAVHPREATRPKVDKKRRLAVIREHESRTGSVNTGGVTRQKILTAYKEQSLQVAKLLRDNGPQQAESLRKLGGPENTAAILRRNVLKWFVRVETLDNGRHVYDVTEAGLEALRQYEELL
jgi:hypothetical protein